MAHGTTEKACRAPVGMTVNASGLELKQVGEVRGDRSKVRPLHGPRPGAKADGISPPLHGYGIFGVTGQVPAGTVAALGENRVAAGDILFRVNGIDFVFDFVALRGDSQETDAVDRSSGWSQFGNKRAELKPGEIH